MAWTSKESDDRWASERLAGEVAIVTGGSGGIGAAIIKRMAADGADAVVNFNHSQQKAAEVVAAIRDAGGKAVAVQADVSDPGEISKLFDAAEAEFGEVTLLVNNAATRAKPAAAPEIDLERFQKLFAVNVQGPVLCIAEFARRAGSRGGRIINITSGQARTPMPATGLYAGAKGALESFTRAFAADLGPHGITVNAVAPGATATAEFNAAVPEEVKQRTIQGTALGRLGTPEDIADVVAFLLSADAHWVTGQVLDVNGGLRRG